MYMYINTLCIYLKKKINSAQKIAEFLLVNNIRFRPKFRADRTENGNVSNGGKEHWSNRFGCLSIFFFVSACFVVVVTENAFRSTRPSANGNSADRKRHYDDCSIVLVLFGQRVIRLKIMLSLTRRHFHGILRRKNSLSQQQFAIESF